MVGEPEGRLVLCLSSGCTKMTERGSPFILPPVPGCLRPLASSNGYVNISEFQTSFPVGTVISYHCFPGFKLEGPDYLECLHSLIWSASPPRCLALEGKTSHSFGS